MGTKRRYNGVNTQLGLEGCKIARVQNIPKVKTIILIGLEGCKIARVQNVTTALSGFNPGLEGCEIGIV